MDAFIFFVAAALALAGALGVVLLRNPAHCALSLVVTLISVAIFFAQLDAALLVAMQIIVYAGAIVVLFLFVIMLLGVDRHETLTDGQRFQRPAAILFGLLAFAGLVALTTGQWELGVKPAGSRSIVDETGSAIRPISRELFTRFAWPFEVTAVLLVIAVVGAVVLARRAARSPR